jgi:hypothetical protein
MAAACNLYLIFSLLAVTNKPLELGMYIMYFILELLINMVEEESENSTSNYIITHKLKCFMYACNTSFCCHRHSEKNVLLDSDSIINKQ